MLGQQLCALCLEKQQSNAMKRTTLQEDLHLMQVSFVPFYLH